MLIVEGTDLVGKTTFAQKLVKALHSDGYVYRHMTRLPIGFVHPIDYFPLAMRRAVYDRFHMSEIAYAAARGDDTDLCPERYRLVDAYLRGLGAYTVVIVADDELIKERWGRDEMYDQSTVHRANAAFKEVTKTEAMMDNAELFKYDVDCDMVIYCSKHMPYPTDDHVNDVLEKYRMRQITLHSIQVRERGYAARNTNILDCAR